MLPVVMYNMEGSSNAVPNSNFGLLFDDNIILNSVRSRKKVSELPNCPVCSCTIRQGELESHLGLEVDRLNKLSCGGSKRKLSANSPGSSNPMPGSSSSADQGDVDVSGCLGSDVYQEYNIYVVRVHSNRLKRLRARRRSSPPPQQGECPVCNASLPVSRLHRHALRCLKRTGAEMDEDIPDTSSEEGSIDVENDEPAGFGAEYQWCGEWRVRAAALQRSDARPATAVRRASSDRALVVDGDEDTELYGPPQYSPSRIAPDAVIPAADDETNGQPTDNSIDVPVLKPNGIVEASAETRIQALKEKIKELEKKQNSSLEAKCLICLGPYVSPAVSIQCWHVYCEVCWLQSLRAKKICPQCNAITTADHLRRIYM
ncbi:E3 ubiquitin-protein ligase Rnf220 [Melitaea cinxia]|uniref:E3 ubiquitin-protein ligase Rnf220 n=1 Tax=Melitaea cinxia TaxID=113334 RepID=UPI001E26ED57|nr:E3 ubiquitin-protein ligase Rnf220 [Melitaea cinxia]